MTTATQFLTDLTAADLMTRDPVLLAEATPLRDAARLLRERRIGGAPVVDARGRCVGDLSETDLLRLSGQNDAIAKAAAPPLPLTCSHLAELRLPDGRAVSLCKLAPDVCPLQSKRHAADGSDLLVCTQPNCVLVEWQVVEVEKLPTDRVGRFMSPDPAVAAPGTPIRDLARRLRQPQVHRVIVVDPERRPLGIVTRSNLIAALAETEDRRPVASAEQSAPDLIGAFVCE